MNFTPWRLLAEMMLIGGMYELIAATAQVPSLVGSGIATVVYGSLLIGLMYIFRRFWDEIPTDSAPSGWPMVGIMIKLPATLGLTWVMFKIYPVIAVLFGMTTVVSWMCIRVLLPSTTPTSLD